MSSTMNPVSSSMPVKIWTDCAGDGIAFSRRVRKSALTCAAEAGRKVASVKGGAEGTGEGA